MGHNILRASSPLTLERWLICQLVIPKSLLAHAFFHTNRVSHRSAHAPWHCLTAEGKRQRFFFLFLIEIHVDFHSSFVTRSPARKYAPSPLPTRSILPPATFPLVSSCTNESLSVRSSDGWDDRRSIPSLLPTIEESFPWLCYTLCCASSVKTYSNLNPNPLH